MNTSQTDTLYRPYQFFDEHTLTLWMEIQLYLFQHNVHMMVLYSSFINRIDITQMINHTAKRS